ncbi:MAG: substrate-binding domain-containing protein, partial [Spirochaetaceae bacterium]|nr:substrate-binding domain-containing protein [Spirochaetaceae bacterium]
MKSSANNRKTIGLLTGSIPHQISLLEWRGVIDAAKENDVNLISFCSEALGDKNDFKYQANAINNMINTERLDGLIIWTAMINWFVTKEELSDFVNQFRGFPIVSAEVPIPGYHSVLMDDYMGMRQVIEHLVLFHKYSKIAFIQGSDGHSGLQERFRAYKDVLMDNGITIDKRIITDPCEFYSENATRIVLELLDNRNFADFEAIVAPSESFALGALFALQQRGVKVPDEIALVCFDDTELIASATPPITTAYAPLIEIGKRALEDLIILIEGKDIPESTYLQAKMITRQSCGCRESIFLSKLEHPDKILEEIDKSILKKLFIEKKKILRQELPKLWKGFFLPQWNDIICHSFFEALIKQDIKSAAAYFMDMEKILDDLSFIKKNLSDINCICDYLKEFIECHFPYMKIIERNLYLFQQMKDIITITSQRLYMSKLVYDNFFSDIEWEKVRHVGQLLITTFSITELFDLIIESFPDLGIKSCFIASYEDPESNLRESHMEMAFTEKIRLDVSVLPSYPTNRLLPDELYSSLSESGCNLLVQALYFRKHQIGYLITDVGNTSGFIYEVLRGMISSAFHGAMLVQNLNERTVQLEESNSLLNSALEKLKETQKQLVQAEKIASMGRIVTGVAHEINTPLGVCVTSLSYLDNTLKELKADFQAKKLTKHEIDSFLNTTEEALHLAINSLDNVASMVSSFKKMDVDKKTEQHQLVN